MSALGFHGLLLCVGFAGHLSGAAVTNEFSAVGEWSGETNGLRGRLLFAERPTSVAGLRDGFLYVELQNVAPGDALQFFYDPRKKPPQFQPTLRDADRKEVKPDIGAPPSGFPQPSWLVLPFDSTLRLRTGGSSISPAKPGLFIMAGLLSGRWFISGMVTNDYYLSATFTATIPADETRPRMWEGTLKLPPLRIPRDRE
jgi:hypothetical protein